MLEETAVHPLLEPLSPLLGTWRGQGKGHYPTIEDFAYGEESRFWHAGRPVMSYAQRTWSLADGSPLHSEMGFIRPQEDGGVEFLVAHAFGIAEVSEGTVAGSRIELTSRSLSPTASADEVISVRRVIEVVGDTLTYDLEMAAAGRPLQHHLSARLARATP